MVHQSSDAVEHFELSVRSNVAQAGGLLCGDLIVANRQPVTVDAVEVLFRGDSLARWMDLNSEDLYETKLPLVDITANLADVLKEQADAAAPNPDSSDKAEEPRADLLLPPGVYHLPFKIQLPPELPSSVNSIMYGRTLYTLGAAMRGRTLPHCASDGTISSMRKSTGSLMGDSMSSLARRFAGADGTGAGGKSQKRSLPAAAMASTAGTIAAVVAGGRGHKGRAVFVSDELAITVYGGRRIDADEYALPRLVEDKARLSRCWCMRRNQVAGRMEVPASAFVLGDRIPVTVSVEQSRPSSSEIDVRLALCQRLTFVAAQHLSRRYERQMRHEEITTFETRLSTRDGRLSGCVHVPVAAHLPATSPTVAVDDSAGGSEALNAMHALGWAHRPVSISYVLKCHMRYFALYLPVVIGTETGDKREQH